MVIIIGIPDPDSGSLNMDGDRKAISGTTASRRSLHQSVSCRSDCWFEIMKYYHFSRWSSIGKFPVVGLSGRRIRIPIGGSIYFVQVCRKVRSAEIPI